MNEHDVKQLLSKYYAGETSLVEESDLKQFFASNQVSSDLHADRELFLSFSTNMDSLGSDELIGMFRVATQSEQPPSIIQPLRVRNLAAILTVAASFLLVLGIGWLLTNKTKQYTFHDTYSDPQEAYMETKRILLAISGTMNGALVHMETIEKLALPSQKLEPLQNISRQMDNIRMIDNLNLSVKSTQLKSLIVIDQLEEEEY